MSAVMKCIMVLLILVKLHNRSHGVRLDTSIEKSKCSRNIAHMSKGRGQTSTRCHLTISPHQNSRKILGMENSAVFEQQPSACTWQHLALARPNLPQQGRAPLVRSLTPLSNPPTPHHAIIQRARQFG